MATRNLTAAELAAALRGRLTELSVYELRDLREQVLEETKDRGGTESDARFDRLRWSAAERGVIGLKR